MQFSTSFIIALAAVARMVVAAPTPAPEGQLEQRDPQRDGTLYVIKRDESQLEQRDPQRDGTLYVIKRDESQLEQRDPQRDGTLYVIKRDESQLEQRDPQRDGTLYVIRRGADGSEEEVDINTLAEREPILYEAIERMI